MGVWTNDEEMEMDMDDPPMTYYCKGFEDGPLEP